MHFKPKHRTLLIALILGVFYWSFPLSGSAQESDLNLWSRFALKYDLSPTARLALEDEIRMNDNLSKLEQHHTEIGLNQELTKRWEAGVYYRFMYETDKQRAYSLGHRGWLQLQYLLVDTNFEISVRSRLQTTFKDYLTSSDGRIPEWYSRNKISCSYKPKKAQWIPGAGLEFWYGLNNPESRFIDKYRANIGLEYRQSKHLRWEIFYSLQQELQVANPATDHILGLCCTYLIN